MVTSLLAALILIAIICVIANVLMSLTPIPPPIRTLVWAVVTILCLLVLLGAVTGQARLL